jgi:RimJ/RimL family protein N-acetyltransferase
VSPVEHSPPPYLIRTERLAIRCWDPRDAPLLKDALDASLEHLVPWMPWAADEPRPLEEKAELLRMFRGRFDLGEDFVYGIFPRDESEVIGGSVSIRGSDPGRSRSAIGSAPRGSDAASRGSRRRC